MLTRLYQLFTYEEQLPGLMKEWCSLVLRIEHPSLTGVIQIKRGGYKIAAGFVGHVCSDVPSLNTLEVSMTAKPGRRSPMMLKEDSDDRHNLLGDNSTTNNRFDLVVSQMSTIRQPLLLLLSCGDSM